jgi:hypothetical protein
MPRRAVTGLHLVLLGLMVAFLSACGAVGPGDGSGSAGDFFTSRRTDIFLRGFFSRPADPNAPGTPVTAWSPFHLDDGADDRSGGRSDPSIPDINDLSQFLFDDVFAVFTISNGISARLDQALLQFTEVDGSPIVDFNVTPPTATAGRFDYPIRQSISLVANPITSIGLPLTEPLGNPTGFAIPLNIFKSGIYEFLLGQPLANRRPFLCRVTFTGRDILDSPFTIVGFLMVSPVLQNTERTQTGGGGAGAVQ